MIIDVIDNKTKILTTYCLVKHIYFGIGFFILEFYNYEKGNENVIIMYERFSISMIHSEVKGE